MKISDIKQLKEGTLSVDVPNEDWLADKIDYAKSKGRNSYGVPYMGSTTAHVRGTPPRVRVQRLASLPGMRDEQRNVRKDDLAWLMDYMDKNKRLPPMGSSPDQEYLPYIAVAYNGEAWVNEGNHRIMAAYRLNWPDMPVEIRYFDGGERVKDGPMYPGKIGLGEVKEHNSLNEIGRMDGLAYSGGRKSLRVGKSEKQIKKLPGNNAFMYSTEQLPIIGLYGIVIKIWDPEKTTPKPVQMKSEDGEEFAWRLRDWERSQGEDVPGSLIGKLVLEDAEHFPLKGAVQVDTITVDEDYRGQGIAKSMYGVALSILKKPLIAGSSQTPGGRKNWVSLSQIPGVEVKGYIVLVDSQLEDTQIDIVMGQLGGQYIGKSGDKHYFAFDVVPGTNELAPAVKTSLSKIYGKYGAGLYALWHGTETNEDLTEAEATGWTALEVVESILGKDRVTADDDELVQGMYYVYESNSPPQFEDTEEPGQPGGAIRLRDLEGGSPVDIAEAAHEACHAYAHSKSTSGVLYTNEKIINNLAEIWLKKNLTGPALHFALEHILGSKLHYGPDHMPRSMAEARVNPDQNTKPESGKKELVAVAKTIADPENWAISMTSEPKLGINPQVGISEDTPKGIYFYPLDYAVDMARRGKDLPWGDNYPYIQLFQYDRSGEMTQQTEVDTNKLKQALRQYCSDDVIQQAIDEPEYDGTPYWTIYDCLSRLGKSDETNVVRWNKVLRDLGFTSVYDPGKGWIAYNEPTQGVVLDPRIIKQLKTIDNKQQSSVVTPAKIEQAIFETMDMELAANRAWQAYDPDGVKLRAAAKEYAKDPKFKPYMGKPGTEEIYDKASGFGRWGARQLSDEAWAWYQAQQPKTESIVNELFDPAHAGELEWNFGGTQAVTDIDGDTHLVVNFREHSNPYGIEFHVNHEFDITGGGNVSAIFATVIKAIKEFIATKSDCYALYFTASEKSRARMYDTLAKRVAKQLGWHVVPYDDMMADEKYDYAKESGDFVFAIEKGTAPAHRQLAQAPQHGEFLTVFYVYTVEFPKLPVIKIKAKTGRDAEDWVKQNVPEYKDADEMGMFAGKAVPKGKEIIDKGTVTESIVNEGGWASTATQNTVITPRTVAEIIHILDGFEASYNAWQAGNELDTEIKIGKPKGSGTYYRRDLEQDPTREYGDVDVECFIHSREGVKSAQRITEYKQAITEYCLQSPDFNTDNGTNVIMRTTDGPVQVDLIYTYHEHADWSRVLSPEYRVKGVISTSLTSSIAEALNLSFSSQGIQVKIRNNQPVSFRQSKDTELRTVSTSPETWAQDIYSLYYYLIHGQQPESLPRELQAHGGLKDEQRLSDIVLSIKALATGLEEANLLGHGALIDIADKRDLIRRVAQIYSAKLEAAENSSKFDKASTPAAVEKAKKTKLMMAKYRNEITKLLLN